MPNDAQTPQVTNFVKGRLVEPGWVFAATQASGGPLVWVIDPDSSSASLVAEKTPQFKTTPDQAIIYDEKNKVIGPTPEDIARVNGPK